MIGGVLTGRREGGDTEGEWETTVGKVEEEEFELLEEKGG